MRTGAAVAILLVSMLAGYWWVPIHNAVGPIGDMVVPTVSELSDRLPNRARNAADRAKDIVDTLERAVPEFTSASRRETAAWDRLRATWARSARELPVRAAEAWQALEGATTALVSVVRRVTGG